MKVLRLTGIYSDPLYLENNIHVVDSIIAVKTLTSDDELLTLVVLHLLGKVLKIARILDFRHYGAISILKFS